MINNYNSFSNTIFSVSIKYSTSQKNNVHDTHHNITNYSNTT